MKTLWLVVILCGAVLANANHCSGFGYEIIVAILETIQTDVKAIQSNVDQLNGEFTGHKTAMDSKIDQLMNSDIKAIRTNVEHLKNDQHKLNEQFTNHKSTINSKLDQLKSDQDKLNEGIADNGRAMGLLMNGFRTVQNCPENRTSGIYKLQLLSQPVYCDEGWIVIQRRLDGGSLSFNRNWTEYRNGFGDLQGEFWMGLEKMHQITRTGWYELLVVMKNKTGQEMRAKYTTFKIASEAEQYRLDVDRFIEGNAGDQLTNYNGMKFSTPDRDNDNHPVNCAQRCGCGWWFNFFSSAMLNGERTGIGFHWDFEELSESRMMIRAEK